MILHVAILLCFQLLGVVLSRLFLPILPGPVLGLVLCLGAFILWPRLAEMLQPTANGILAHLSLLFVPAGVGVVGHWSLLVADGPALLATLCRLDASGAGGRRGRLCRRGETDGVEGMSPEVWQLWSYLGEEPLLWLTLTLLAYLTGDGISRPGPSRPDSEPRPDRSANPGTGAGR